MFDWIEKHKKVVIIGVIIALFVLSSLIPFTINILFKIKSNGIFSAEWSAGDFLQFYGSLLSFVSTVILSILALWQNKTIKDEADKRAALAEQMELIKNMPKFSCKSSLSNGRVSNLNMIITNISENVANDILVCNIRIVDDHENITWSTNSEFQVDALLGDKELKIKLDNPPLTEDGLIFRFSIKCKDKFNANHIYEAIGKCETAEKHPNFRIIEIT